MKVQHLLVLLVAWPLLVAALSAQTVPPALMVKEGDVSKPLGLAKLEIHVRIFGSVAQTTTTMTFANPTDRPMEGDLYFPLPEGATVTGYALDIAGAMVDGVAVEKHEARRVFEEIVRQGIDPGLVQWTKGNTFQTRVFPIPAHGSRTVRVEYVSELIGGQDAPTYHLPLNFKEKVPEFSLRVEVVKPAAPPVVAQGGPANFAFEKWRDSYVAETQQKDWLPADENLVVALPKTAGPRVLVEKTDDGQIYFAVEDHSAPPAATATRQESAPRRVVIFWDASGSRAGDHAREIALLRSYVERLSATPDRTDPGDVDLILLRNVASNPKRFTLDKKGIRELVAEIEKVQYDGGTQLGAIRPAVDPAVQSTRYLLFTDGLSNFGQEEPARLDGPLDVFSAASTVDHATLRRLATSNGGRYFNLVKWSDAEVLAQIDRPAWSFLSASIEGGPAKDLYPQLPEPLAGRFTLVGRLDSESTTVTVLYGYGMPGESPTKKTFTVSRTDAVEGSLLRRLWAEKKLAELMVRQKKNRKEIATLGKQFNLVTPYTSLLVLDSLDQYVEYEIAPPASLKEMREEYLRRIDTLEHQKQKKKASKLAKVLRMWKQRVKWWNTKFKYSEHFKYGEKEEEPVYPDGRSGRSRSQRIRRYGGGMGGGGMGGMGMGGMGGGEAHPASPAATSPPAETAVRSMPLSALRKFGVAADRQPGIAIKPWNPDTPYLKKLRAAKDDRARLAVYMKSRAKYGNSPAFFLDCAEFFREAGDA
ncbi:MAG TPA: VIT domain-containing protein, partial [Thermoguttaceae bacterium]|nr:VIT domain-containing protein [Thermoguttaceae bacterium]